MQSRRKTTPARILPVAPKFQALGLQREVRSFGYESVHYAGTLREVLTFMRAPQSRPDLILIGRSEQSFESIRSIHEVGQHFGIPVVVLKSPASKKTCQLAIDIEDALIQHRLEAQVTTQAA